MPNPTGSVDPLGLNSCPEDKYTLDNGVTDPTATAVVDEYTPITPKAEKRYLYRGDTQPHEIILSEGFKSKGNSMSLEMHIFDNNIPPSNFISTSSSREVAIDFGTPHITKKGQLNTLKVISGHNANHELGSKVPFPEEKVIAIPNRILPEDILGVTPLKADGTYIGYSIPNPKRQYK